MMVINFRDPLPPPIRSRTLWTILVKGLRVSDRVLLKNEIKLLKLFYAKVKIIAFEHYTSEFT